jgi:cell division protein FtsL
MKIGAKPPQERRRTPPTGPGVRQLHQRRLERSRVRGGPRQGPAPDRPLRLALLATALLTVGTIFGAAIFHVLLIQSEFRLDQLNKEAAREEARYEKLRLDVAQLSAPERIVATAQQRLGMVVPPQIAYLMAPAPVDSGDTPGARGAEPDDPAAPSLAGGWAEVKPHLGTRP